MQKITHLFLLGLAAGGIAVGYWFYANNATFYKAPTIDESSLIFGGSEDIRAQSGGEYRMMGKTRGAQIVSGGNQAPTLETPKARQGYYDELQAMAVMPLWQHWQELLSRGSPIHLMLATPALAQRLQKEGVESIYLEAADLLKNPALSDEQRASVVDLLSRTATKEAMEVLTQGLSEKGNKTLSFSIQEGIKRAGDQRWNGRFHPELSPALESVWSDAVDNPKLQYALALAIAKVGAPSGVEMLLTEIAKDGRTVAEIYKGGNVGALTALEAMNEVRNPDVLPVLAKWFTTRSEDEAAFVASGEALASMGSPEATRILLDWAKHAPDEAAPLVGKWTSMARDTESLKLLRDAELKTDFFSSARVRQTIIEALSNGQ
jgi:hypothetical protein